MVDWCVCGFHNNAKEAQSPSCLENHTRLTKFICEERINNVTPRGWHECDTLHPGYNHYLICKTEVGLHSNAMGQVLKASCRMWSTWVTM